MDTVGTAGVSNAPEVLTSRLGAMTQSTGTTIPIYPDYYLLDTLNGRLNQINWKTLTMLSADGNPVSVVILKNFAICYSTYTYAVGRQNGKIYAIYPAG